MTTHAPEPLLLCRTAENLFWAGRYVERAECLARLVIEHTELLVDLPASAPLRWDALLAVPGEQAPFAARYEVADEPSIMRFLLADTDNPNSLVSSLARGRENLRTTRQVFPRSAWRVINELAQYGSSTADLAVQRNRRREVLDRVVGACQQLAGSIEGSMRRDSAYEFWRLGTQIERADMTTRVLEVRAATLLAERDSPQLELYGEGLWLGVLHAVLGFHAFRRTTSAEVTGSGVVSFLLTDPAFPRSMARCLQEMEWSLEALPKAAEVAEAIADARVLLGSVATRAEDPAALVALTDDLQLALIAIDSALSGRYFHRGR